MIDLVWLIPVLPLVGFLINGLLARRFQEQVIGWIGALSVGASFVITVSDLQGTPRHGRLRHGG